MQLLDFIDSIITGGFLVVILLGVGIYFTVGSGFYPFRKLGFIYNNTVGTLLKKRDKHRTDGISPFQAVTTALAGTMGVGNIAGVATALVAGGPGAVFWMWVGAFFGMMTKYTEIFLAVKYRKKNKDGQYYGGPMYYMQELASKNTKWLAPVFAVACAACSLGIGNMTQVNSVSTAVYSVFNIPTIVSGIIVALLVALVIFGGLKRIAAVTEIVIPFISIIYIFCAGAFLFIYRDGIIDALKLIVSSAFSLRGTAGGLAGYGVRQAMYTGLSRGVFTNEAGLGSAPIAHAAADCKSPEHQSVWGIFEVFLDTVVVCTITALVVLLSGGGQLWNSGLDGAPLTSAAFASQFGDFGSKFIAISILFFAISAMLGWCYYGETSLGFLFPHKKAPVKIYRLIFIICIIIGAVGRLEIIWRLSDTLNALMVIPNIIALWLLRKQVKYN